jgi:cytochrome c oxidase subunit II
MNGIVEMPPAASVYAHHVDTLFWSMTAVTGTVALGVIILMVTFCIRYRKAARSDRTLDETPAGKHRQHLLEIAWITIPLLIFVVFFVWAARLYFDYEVSPEHPLEIYVVAKQWMWKLEHPNGRREINELHVPRGRVIKLVMTSQDVIHSFYMPAFRIKRDVVPGQFATIWFAPTSAGDYHLFCAEYCGTDHSRMGGRIIVMEPECTPGGSPPAGANPAWRLAALRISARLVAAVVMMRIPASTRPISQISMDAQYRSAVGGS